MTAPIASRFATLALVALLYLAGGCAKGRQSAATMNSATHPSSAADSPAGAGSQAAATTQASASDTDAIRAAIEDHLRGNQSLNMDAMQMVVDSVAIKGDRAQAHASFHVKNGGPTGMTMQYFLQRSGNGWVVTNGQPADGNTELPPSAAARPGPNSTQAAPSIPDVDAFLKDHPSQKSN
ncbi:MAG: hypothetical protein ACRD4X_11265 [Candidatus Acidiferrales bacterium]